jgi:hypothetical protein
MVAAENKAQFARSVTGDAIFSSFKIILEDFL